MSASAKHDLRHSSLLVVRPANATVDSDGHWLNGHNGGVWEWTSSELVGLEGYEQSEVYPGFSSDFFDGLHNVVVGSCCCKLCGAVT